MTKKVTSFIKNNILRLLITLVLLCIAIPLIVYALRNGATPADLTLNLGAGLLSSLVMYYLFTIVLEQKATRNSEQARLILELKKATTIEVKQAIIDEMNSKTLSQGAKLQWIQHLENTSWAHAHLEKTDFGGCRLENANFYNSHLKSATFGSAHIEGADFGHADLTNVDFSASHLTVTGGTFKADTDTILPNCHKWHPGTDMSQFTSGDERNRECN